MLPAEQARGEELVTLARTRFDPNLAPIEEQALRHSCAYEDPADWTPDPDTPDPTRHESTGRPLPGSQLPEFRTALVRWLLTTPDATALLEPRGLRIWNARLTQALDLIGCATAARLELRYCLVEAPLYLHSASLPTLSLRNSTLERTLDAPFLKLHGPLCLDDITAAATLNFNAAAIPAEVLIANTTLTATGYALSMAGASITNDLILDPEFQSSGRLYLKGIHIGGFIGLADASLTTTDTALHLDGATIDGGVYLTGKFNSAGEIRMLDAHIGGELNCTGAKLTKTGDGLSLDRAAIDGSVFLDDGFESAGEIRLQGAHIGGVLSCRGAKLTTTGDALSLDGATIDGDVFLNNGFESAGAIRLPGAHIGGQLNCSGAKLTTTLNALILDVATIDGGAFLDDGFESAGKIRLHGAHIGGVLTCIDASIQSLVGENTEIRGDLFWQQIKNPEQASLNLMGAKIKAIRDDQASWPAKGNLLLDGLHAEDLWPLHAHHLDTTGRIAWLNRQPDADLAEPQPWVHLAAHLEAKGHKRAARRVTYELHKHQANANWQKSRYKWLGQPWAIAFAWLEEQPLRILWSIAFCVALGTAFFWPMHRHFAPTSDAAYKASSNPTGQPIAYPKFQPIVYALENVLPIVHLGQDAAWAPDANPTHTKPALYRTLAGVRWFLILAGWAQGVVLAAAVSARFRT